MREELIQEAIIASYGLNKKGIEKCNKEGILTENGEILTKEELEKVIEYRLGKLYETAR
jgi:hypothetical protein